MMRRRFSFDHGQSLVEVVAMAPIVVLCGLLGLQALAAGSVYVFADNSAHAGALAAQLGNPPAAAARAALPGWASGRVQVKRVGTRVTVKLEPRAIVPRLSALLAVESSATYAESSGGFDGK